MQFAPWPTEGSYDLKHVMRIIGMEDISRNSIGNVNEKQGQPSAEQELWAAVLREAIMDSVGASLYWNQHCVECHIRARCGCEHVVARKDWKRYANGKFKVRREWRLGATWKVDTSPNHMYTRYDGKTVLKFFKPHCPAAHTYQWCALQWIQSDEAANICEMVGYNIDYLRRKILAMPPARQKTRRSYKGRNRRIGVAV